MKLRKTFFPVVGLGLAALMISPASHAGGFAVCDQGAAAIGVGGAVTARSDAADTLFYNVAGAAFFTEPTHELGVLYRAAQNLALETQPSIGEIASTFGQDDPTPVLAHGYTVQPVAPKLNVGVAVYSPFDLDNSHTNPDSFPGRGTSLASTIRTVDANFSAAARFGKRLGVGVGAIVRVSTFSLLQRVDTTDPATGGDVDYGTLAFDTDPRAGVGWNMGVLYKASDRLSMGLAYRSRITIDYDGTGKLEQIATGNTQLDDLLALTQPFGEDLPLRTRIEFPDMASLGVALRPSRHLLIEADVNRTGWSSVDEIDLLLPSFPSLNDQVPLHLEDASTFRVGAELTTASGAQWRLGYAFDQSPQRGDNVSPFLIDSDRNVISLGFGRDWLQVAVQWINYASRTGSSEELSGTFFGDAWQLSITLRKKKKPELPKFPEVPELKAPAG